MNPRFALPLAGSLALHGCLVVLLILFVGRVAPLALPPAPKPAIEIMLAPAEPPPPEPPPPAAAVEPPPPPPPPPVAAEPPPPPPVVQDEPPPPPPPPVIQDEPPPPPLPRSKPVVTRPPPRIEPPPRREPVAAPPPPLPYRPPLPPPAPVQTAAIPRPPPPAGPLVSPGYRAALAGWLESHKRYPESARARGEAGQAVLRFHVERSGRVLNYAIAKSTGYPELDAAIDRMMQGAALPPFPADMSASDIEVSVAIRFALAR